MIVDAHTHIYEAGHGGPFRLESSADALVRDMDEAGIDVSVVIPLPGVAGNDFVARQCRKYPDRLALVYTPEFDAAAGVIPTMEEFFSREEPCAIKVHPRVQAVGVGDARVRQVAAWAAVRGVPLIFDVFPWGDRLDDPAIYPLAYHALAQELPELKLVLAHAGGLRVLEAFLVAKSNPNVWLEFSMTPVYFRGSSVVQDCAFACQRLPEGRVLYGSDFPQVRLGESLAHARSWGAGLSPSASAALFGEAAQRLYGIGPQVR